MYTTGGVKIIHSTELECNVYGARLERERVIERWNCSTKQTQAESVVFQIMINVGN